MADTLGDLTSALQTYVVAPLNAFGMGGFLFNVESEGRAEAEADITDHWAEDNQSLQDHMAIKPLIITLRGFVGELVYAPNNSDLAVLQSVTQKLTTISSYLPALSAAATQAEQAIADTESSGINSSTFNSLLQPAANIYSLVQNAIGAFGLTKNQQRAFQYFQACQSQKILMGIQTPWAFLTSMAVRSVRAIQSEDSIFTSDFMITFKQMRFASTQTAVTPLSGTGGLISPGGVVAQGATGLQAQAQTSLGVVTGVQPPTPLLPGAQANISTPASIVSTPSLNQIYNFSGLN